ncbi:hypothetical protein Syun_031981 [Stephania yunnanensis]|uniref:Uncharacterized protein n=1 Tax=Stephania yunnanensis TaxID=152371 RepID=A0AAP0HBP9_9MAGN
MKMHLRGRLLIECSVVRGHLDGTDPEPSEDDDRDKKTIREWYLVDNRIMAIIGQSVVPSIRLQLGKFTSAKEMWDFLSGTYVQSSHARESQLTLSQYTVRGCRGSTPEPGSPPNDDRGREKRKDKMTNKSRSTKKENTSLLVLVIPILQINGMNSERTLQRMDGQVREGSGKAWIGQGAWMIGSKGRRKPYKIRHFLVNRTSPVLVSSEREGGQCPVRYHGPKASQRPSPPAGRTGRFAGVHGGLFPFLSRLSG